MVAQRARDELCAVAFCALVGGQDELVFDGHSFVVDHDGAVIARAPQFEEALLVCDVDTDAAGAARLRDTRRRRPAREAQAAVDAPRVAAHARPPGRTPARSAARVADTLPEVDEVYAALVLGTRDYARKNGFGHAVLGLSGGIDSDARRPRSPSTRSGADAVTCVIDALALHVGRARSPTPRRWPRNLGVDLLELPIAAPMAAYEELLRDVFAGREPDLTEENLQARIRGNLLMALSNKFGWLVLTTGNKSEMAVGYSTLYGDSAGGFAVIKDVPKTLVFQLARRARRPRGRRAHPARSSSRGRRRPSCAPTRTTRTRCRPTTSSTRSWRATSSRTSAASSSSRAACRPRTSTASSASSTSPSTSAASSRPASRSRARPSAATAASRSPTATAGEAGVSVALVTGADNPRGIGRATCRELAARRTPSRSRFRCPPRRTTATRWPTSCARWARRRPRGSPSTWPIPRVADPLLDAAADALGAEVAVARQQRGALHAATATRRSTRRPSTRTSRSTRARRCCSPARWRGGRPPAAAS